MKKVKIIPIKLKSVDTDRDGVPDYCDCQPLNPFKHSFLDDYKEKKAGRKYERDYDRKVKEIDKKAKIKKQTLGKMIEETAQPYAWQCKKCGEVYPQSYASDWRKVSVKYGNRRLDAMPSCTNCGADVSQRMIVIAGNDNLYYWDTLGKANVKIEGYDDYWYD